MDSLKPPDKMCIDGDLAANWRQFIQQFKLYLTAIGANAKSGVQKVAMLLTVAGPGSIDIYNTFVLTEAEAKEFDTVVLRFEEHCAPRTNEVFERYVFRCRVKHETESYDSFITDLRLKARTCNFDEMKQSLIRDQIVFGTNVERDRAKLLHETDLNLDKTIKICLANEATRQHLKSFHDQHSAVSGDAESTEINVVRRKANNYQNSGQQSKSQNVKYQQRQPQNQQFVRDCKYCGERHSKGRCPAYGRNCNFCGGLNHFEVVCYAKTRSERTSKAAIQTVERYDLQQDTGEFFIGTVDIHNAQEQLVDYANSVDELTSMMNTDISNHDYVDNDVHVVTYDYDAVHCDTNEYNRLCSNDSVSNEFDDVNAMSLCSDSRVPMSDRWTEPLIVNGSLLLMKLDTGAKVNLISQSDLTNLSVKPKMLKQKAKLRAYNGTEISSIGMCRLLITMNGKNFNCLFAVVAQGQSLLCDNDCERLGLIKRVKVNVVNTDTDVLSDFCHKYESAFKPDSGKFSSLPFTYKIELIDGAQPVVHAARRVPAALRDDVKNELDRMENMGIIRKVSEPTEWVNSMVVVRKPNKSIRICLDPKDLNTCIKRVHYQLPKKEEILSEMAGATHFTKLDASHGFWQIQMDQASAMLCTFNTPFGRYCYERLPFGICSAPEYFHRTIEQLFEGLDGVRVFMDDVVVWGVDQKQHDNRLDQVMKRICTSGLQLNKDKCRISQQEITFLGDKITPAGIQPGFAKVHAINELERPTNKVELQRFMGMINYVGRFIPDLSTRTASLRSLLTLKSVWQWQDQQESEWIQLKETLTKEPVLKFFDPGRHIKISADASKSGLGGVLLQKYDEDWAPVAYASRSMTDTETRYAQIEKENLALAFACERFHDYVYGLQFELETDHKPLVAISKKSLADMTPRIQRMMMKLQRYDYILNYTPGKKLLVADALSRSIKDKTSENSVTFFGYYIWLLSDGAFYYLRLDKCSFTVGMFCIT